MCKVIGITGRAGSGKDTFANFLLQHSTGHVRYSFADPIKDAIQHMFGWTRDELEHRVFKEKVDPEWGFSPRRAMQLLGTEFGRACREDLWLHFAQIELEKRIEEGWLGLVIPDVRFENEAAWVRQNGILIHINRPSGNETSETAHASEAGVAPIDSDGHILNDGSLEALESYAMYALREMNTTSK